MAESVIMLGFGTAKSGMTWLYRCLARRPEVSMPALKELHWFDTCETGRRDHTAAGRSDNVGTLAQTARVLNPATLFLGFFKKLSEGDTIARLGGFLGTWPRSAATEIRVLRGEDLDLIDDQQGRTLTWMALQYAAVAARSGKLPRRWQDNMEAFA